MSDSEISQERFKNEIGQFLQAVMTIRTVDTAAFCRIENEAAAIMRALKPEDLVSKSLLREFREASKMLRAEAPYIKDRQHEIEDMADKLELMLDLILWGESPDDRTPGVPRIA